MELFVPVRTLMFIRWQFQKMLKLNSDGSATSSGLGAGGGILRDCYGGLIFAYHGYFGKATSLHAEAKALLLGLKLC